MEYEKVLPAGTRLGEDEVETVLGEGRSQPRGSGIPYRVEATLLNTSRSFGGVPIGSRPSHRFPRWVAVARVVGLVLAVGLILWPRSSAAQTEPIRALQEQIARTERESQQTQTRQTQAQTVLTRYEAEVRAAQTALQASQGEMEAARKKYEEAQEWALSAPEFSTEDYRQAYQAAQAARTQAQKALKAAQQRLAQATAQVAALRATLDGHTREIETLKRRVAAAHFERLRDELARPQTVTVRGEFGCGKQSVPECQRQALTEARRRAVEQGAAVLVNGVTVVEDFQLTRDEIRSRVRGIIVKHEVLDEGWAGRSSYFYEIRATVRGEVPEDWWRDNTEKRQRQEISRNRQRLEELKRQLPETSRNRQRLEELERRNIRLEARATARGVVVNLPDILFEFGRSDLTGEAQSRVQGIADVLNDQARGRRISIEGHTDAIGSEEENQRLSERRANSVVRALVALGVDQARMIPVGYGERYPAAPNTNPDGSDNSAGRAKNNRVEVVIEN